MVKMEEEVGEEGRGGRRRRWQERRVTLLWSFERLAGRAVEVREGNERLTAGPVKVN